MVESVSNPHTVGASPKAYVAAAVPLVAGLVLMAVDLIFLDGDLSEVWLPLVGISPVVGAGAFVAKPGTIVSKIDVQ